VAANILYIVFLLVLWLQVPNGKSQFRYGVFLKVLHSASTAFVSFAFKDITVRCEFLRHGRVLMGWRPSGAVSFHTASFAFVSSLTSRLV
jgi:hypothetical protein